MILPLFSQVCQGSTTIFTRRLVQLKIFPRGCLQPATRWHCRLELPKRGERVDRAVALPEQSAAISPSCRRFLSRTLYTRTVAADFPDRASGRPSTPRHHQGRTWTSRRVMPRLRRRHPQAATLVMTTRRHHLHQWVTTRMMTLLHRRHQQQQLFNRYAQLVSSKANEIACVCCEY